MAMHNPPHPGEFISEVYLEPNNLRWSRACCQTRCVRFHAESHPEGNERHQPRNGPAPCKALGRSPESWLAMQYNYDLCQARQHVKLEKVRKVRLTTA